MLTDEQISKEWLKLPAGQAGIANDFARAIESAVLEKLKAQEPVMYMHESGLLTGEDKDYNAGVRTGLYRHPLPPADVVRVAELEAVLRECRDVFAEHCAAYLGHESNVKEAIAKIDEVLNGPASICRCV